MVSFHFKWVYISMISIPTTTSQSSFTCSMMLFSVKMYLFKANNGNSRKRCEMFKVNNKKTRRR